MLSGEVNQAYKTDDRIEIDIRSQQQWKHVKDRQTRQQWTHVKDRQTRQQWTHVKDELTQQTDKQINAMGQ